MLNYVWSFLLLAGVMAGVLFGRLDGKSGITDAALAASKSAVMDIALPLAGAMMLWLGILRVMEKAGLMQALARFLSPVLRLLFPDVPRDHPAMGSMVMNVAANMLGLGNSATPLGLKAMEHLQELNPHKQSASNAMCMFLALNTAGLTFIPMTAINYLSAGGVKNPFQIIGPTLFSSLSAALCAVVAAKLLQRLPVFQAQPGVPPSEPAAEGGDGGTSAPASAPRRRRRWKGMLLGAVAVLAVAGSALEFAPQLRARILQASGMEQILRQAALQEKAAQENAARLQAAAPAAAPAEPAAAEDSGSLRAFLNHLSALAIPLIFAIAVLWGLHKDVPIYEAAVEGAKEGFQVATRIMPFLVIMLGALAIFRASGAMTLLEYFLRPLLGVLHFPVELFPLAVMRPLSGSGSSGILNDIILNPSSTDFLRYTGAVMYGSTETTFYVLTVYFGSVGIRKIRHALAVGLVADVVGMICAIASGRLMFGA